MWFELTWIIDVIEYLCILIKWNDGIPWENIWLPEKGLFDVRNPVADAEDTSSILGQNTVIIIVKIKSTLKKHFSLFQAHVFCFVFLPATISWRIQNNVFNISMSMVQSWITTFSWGWVSFNDIEKLERDIKFKFS